jgi:hypothetical protein
MTIRSLRLAAVLCSVCLALPLAAAPPATSKEKSTCACMPKPVLPVTMSVSGSNQGWSLRFRLPPYMAYTEMFVRFDDHPEESTGHESSLDVMTGKPEIRTSITLPHAWATPGEHTVLVRMVRPDGTVDGPHKLRFNPDDESLAAAKSTIEMVGDEMISFAEHMEENTALMLTGLFSMAESLKEILYSENDCSISRRIVLVGVPEDPEQPSEDRPYVILPKKSTRSACAQVVFNDGTVSRVMRTER